MSTKPPLEQLQDLKQRRESLIASKATLEERQRQNDIKTKEVVQRLQQQGVTEDTLDAAISEKELKLASDIKEYEATLTAEEQKVKLINQSLAKA